MSSGAEKIWFQDPKGFIGPSNYDRFFPSKEMSFAEQLNSLMRFSLYFSLLVFLVRKETNIFFVPIFMAGFTYMLFSVDTKNKQRERFYIKDKGLQQDIHTRELCAAPSKDNPFMNVLISDYALNPQRKRACSITEGKTKGKVKKLFENNLYRDVSDIYNKNASDRNFYTTPITTIPNDQNAFAQYCYGTAKTCKQGNGNKCYQNTYRAVAQ